MGHRGRRGAFDRVVGNRQHRGNELFVESERRGAMQHASDRKTDAIVRQSFSGMEFYVRPQTLNRERIGVGYLVGNGIGVERSEPRSFTVETYVVMRYADVDQ